MAENLELKSSINTYDEVPYDSYPYSQSNLFHMMTLGTLFGIKPAAPANARVLELGCAAGGNIIPHAVNFPKAQIVGIDLSQVQITQANQAKKDLNLKNIDFRCLSITDINEEFGKFDYIICHGVISWVPEIVRDKIFEICNNNLSENGIAYISYNTLPGWNTIRTIRDMMLYHSNMFNNVSEKVSQARLLLEFVKDSLEGSNSPYAEILKAEAALLSKQSDHYLRHDHLEENNTQYYFSDFIAEARKHSLQYLSDASVSTMYLGNMPAKVAEKLQGVNDIVRTEQYMDFITNRRFRSTLLCHQSIKLSRNINNDDITKFNMTFNISPEKVLEEVNLNDSLESLKFFFNTSKENNLSTSSPAMKAILYTFANHINNPISFNQLISEASKKLEGNKSNEIKNEFLNNGMKLFLQGYLNITLLSSRKVDTTNLKSIKLAAYHATSTPNMWVTNRNHEAVGLNLFEKLALKYMNGENDKEAIIKSIMKHVDSKELTISRDGQKIEEQAQIRNELMTALDLFINKATTHALLENR